jgi:hypothetical protein
MAYPTIDAPYGLVPVGLIGGRSLHRCYSPDER